MRIEENFTAAILAGGLGTRLRPVLNDRPKVMAEVNDRPFITYLLDQVAAAGVKRAILCTGYKAERIAAFLGEEYRGMQILYSQEPSPLGTAGALRLALPKMENETVLVMNGDSYLETDLRNFWNRHRAKGATNSLLLTKVSDTGRYGRVETDCNGRILRFVEKGRDGGPGWINAGLYLLSRQLLQSIPDQGEVSLEREVLPNCVDKNFFGFESRGRFLDIGIPESYQEAQSLFQHISDIPAICGYKVSQL
ncbi:MAG: Nucleoside-diphosphate-sugar pyrophosphorylase family [Geobacteraceae bacterium]|nr:MAG: Nucleoside-diphosphate-sugar pyrophosphorylase family [Geobacteraceae bacterium]